MSLIGPSFTESVIVRSADAEVVGRIPTTVRLLADASSTGGALSTQRVTLNGGAGGARPHHHAKSAELFYLLDEVQELYDTYFQSSAPWNQARALSATPGDATEVLLAVERVVVGSRAGRGRAADRLVVVEG